MNDEIIKPFLSRIIRVCNKCGKIDIKTYARYKFEFDGKDCKYVLHSIYSECPECGNKKEFTQKEFEREVNICK